ncbi:MAG: hypothetical protein HZB41_12395 [Ignavibacteriae bacterium]|nr:hypothetical protein [Ignavibacteriota bacterium]
MKIYSKILIYTIISLICLLKVKSIDSPIILNLIEEKPIFPDKNEIIAVYPQLGYCVNFYSSDFSRFQGSVDCGVFKKGTGSGLTGLLGIEFIYNEKIGFSISGGYVDRSGEFNLESIYPVRDDINSGRVVSITTENKLTADIGYLEIQPDIRYILTNKFINGPLRLVVGSRIAFPLNSDFMQNERILSPDNATFIINGQKQREIISGKIATISNFNYGISLGFENLLNIGRGNYISQQILFDYNINNVTKDVKWKIFGLRFIAGLRYSFRKSIKEPIPPPLIPLPLPDTSIIAAKNNKQIIPKINIEYSNVDAYVYKGNYLMATLPLVNAIFFSKNSADIPVKYILNNSKLPSFIDGDAVELHKYIIPRIISIMEKNSDSKLLISGATSGREHEPGGLKLSKVRVDSVYSAIVNLGLSEKMINKKVKLYPEFPSNQDYEEGIKENQRVDLFVEKAPLQEYVSLLKFAEIRGNVKLRINLSALKEDRKIYVKPSFYDTTIIVSKSDSFNIPIKILQFDSTSNIILSVITKTDTLENYSKQELDVSKLPVKLVDLDLSRFEAILRFDYNSSILGVDNKGLLKQMSEILPESTTIIIFGSADALGTEERNKQLEFERANVTKEFIKSISNEKFKFITDVNKTKFSDDTEEGRFLNRSMKIRLK